MEEKPALSLLDKIRGKRHLSSDQPSPAANTPGKRSSFDSGQLCRNIAIAHCKLCKTPFSLESKKHLQKLATR